MVPVALLFLFGAGAAKADAEIHEVEHKAEARLSEALGSEGQVKVTIVPNGPAAIWGDLEELKVEAKDFSLDRMPLYIVPGARASGRVGTLKLRLHNFNLRSLVIEDLDADIPACRYDFGVAKHEGKMDFARSGIGTGKVVIAQDALRDYILHKYSEIKTCKVTIDRDVIIVEGHGEFLVTTTDFMVVARIGVTEGTKLNLIGARIFFGLEKADEASAHALLKQLNPVVDLNKDLSLGDAVSVDKVILRDGKVTALGKSKVPSRK